VPFAVDPAEPAVVNRVLRILSTGDWNPHVFDSPTLVLYVTSSSAAGRPGQRDMRMRESGWSMCRPCRIDPGPRSGSSGSPLSRISLPLDRRRRSWRGPWQRRARRVGSTQHVST
jgi:hypothetical protein